MEKLEKEIEEVLKNRKIGVDVSDTVNIKGGLGRKQGEFRGKSANPGARSGGF